MPDDPTVYDLIVLASLRSDHWPLEETTPVLPPVQDGGELSQSQVDNEIDKFMIEHPAEMPKKRGRK